MPVPAARALARPAVVDDDDVAELHAAAVRPAQRLPARDHAAAEPRAEREHHDVVHPTPDAGAPFSDRRRIRVVVEADRPTECAVHVIAQRKVGERQVDALDDDTAALVDRRRHAEADRADFVVHQLRHGGFELANDGFLGVLGRRTLVPADDVPVAADDAGKDFRASEIYTDRMRCAHAQRVP